MGDSRRMLQSDFMGHLARRGVLRDSEGARAGQSMRRRDARADLDWVGLTKLTQSDFADELAAFYRCARVQRADLIGSQFLGAKLSPRFLKDGRVIPYEGSSGKV